jgi:hypothetical protein
MSGTVRAISERLSATASWQCWQSPLSVWDYPIRSDRQCGASCAPGRNCVDLRDRVGTRPSRDDLVCSYCGKPFEQAFETAPRAILRAGDDLDRA